MREPGREMFWGCGDGPRWKTPLGRGGDACGVAMCWKAGWFCMWWTKMLFCGGECECVCESGRGEPGSSSSSSEPASFLPKKSLGPLCSCAPPYCERCQRCANVGRGAGGTYVLEAADGLVDVVRREFVQLLVVAEDDDGDLDLAQDGQLVGLFEQAAFALEKGAVGAVSRRRASAAGTEGTYTERFLSSLMALISIFRRPMAAGEVDW